MDDDDDDSSDGEQCVVSADCHCHCTSMHAHLVTLPRDKLPSFMHSLTAAQRSGLAATISTLPTRRKPDKPKPESVSGGNWARHTISGGEWNNVLKFSQVLSKTSGRRRAPLYTISKTTRLAPVRFARSAGDPTDQWASSLRVQGFDQIGRVSSSPSLLGPGSYALDADFPKSRSEIKTGLVTTTSRILGYQFDEEERVAEDGALKGLSLAKKIPHQLSPGSYNIINLARYKSPQAPSYTLPKAPTERGRSEMMGLSGEKD